MSKLNYFDFYKVLQVSVKEENLIASLHRNVVLFGGCGYPLVKPGSFKRFSNPRLQEL